MGRGRGRRNSNKVKMLFRGRKELRVVALTPKAGKEVRRNWLYLLFYCSKEQTVLEVVPCGRRSLEDLRSQTLS